MTGQELADLLDAHGYDFFTGVPCSLVEALLAELERDARGGPRPYVPAAREDVAVGLAAGAWLGGRTPAVIMQNSGLGTSLNALVSLSLLYRLPALLLVTWRGRGGAVAPEHILMGEISPALLDLMRLPHRVLTPGGAASDVAWAHAESLRLSQPVALLVPPGLLEPGARHTCDDARDAGRAPVLPRGAEAPAPCIARFDALRAAVDALGDEPVIHANGYVCRESFAVCDRPENFYMINGVYGSTGNQPSPGRGVRLDGLAAAAGYARTACVATADEISGAVREALEAPGPSFILARVTTEERAAPRIPYPPEEIRDRFRRALGRPG